VAATNPGEWGSRIGGVGRAGRAIVCCAGELGCVFGFGEGDCAAADAANVNKTIRDARLRRGRNVDSYWSERFFVSSLRFALRSDDLSV
jgi:hypothetical protein